MAESIPTVKADLHGRTVTVKIPDIAQLGLLQLQSRTLIRSNDNAELQRALELSFRILFGHFPDKEDLHHVQDLVADGEVDVITLTRFIVDSAKKYQDEEIAEAPRAVRRGRPRKAS